MFRMRSRLPLTLATVALVAAHTLAQSGTWTGVQVLEPTMVSSSPPDVPVVACDPVGHVVAAWTSPSMGAVFAERVPGGAWSATGSIHPSSVEGFSPQIAIGTSGVVAATWIVPGNEFTPTKFVASVRPLGGAFSPPVTLVAGSYVFDSKVAVVDNGSVTVVWAQAGIVRTTTRNPAGAWTPVVALSPTNVSAGLVDLAANGAGAALAVWQQTSPGGTGPGAIGTAYRPAPARSRWGASQALASTAGLQTWNPKPGIDADGDAAVGYLDGSAMLVARKSPGGGWTAPAQVSPTTDDVHYPALAMDASGNVLTAWQALDASNRGRISRRVLPVVGPVGPVVQLSTAAQDASWPTASVARDGSIGIVSWGDNDTFAAHADVGPLRGATTSFTIGSVWWNTSVPVAAGASAVTAVWPAPTTNPNVTRMVANSYAP